MAHLETTVVTSEGGRAMLHAPRTRMRLVSAEGSQAKAARHVGRAPEHLIRADREQRGFHPRDLDV